jgi:glycosyltransferase involved in cell wall biosynthesis
MINATVGILTFNSEKYLPRCLKSTKNFREIIILDGGSSDKTLSIARKFKCKIFFQPKKLKYKNNKIKNFSKLKNIIMKLAKNNFILFLDSDEFLENSILTKIKTIIKDKNNKKKYYSYLLGRYPFFQNKIINNKTLFYPNYQERLIYKPNVKTFIKPVHEKPLAKKTWYISKKIDGVAIICPVISDQKKLYEKYNYYNKVEKDMFLTNPNFLRNLQFIFFRIMVMFKTIIANIFLNKKNINDKFHKIELAHIKYNFFFSFKLLKHIFFNKNV